MGRSKKKSTDENPLPLNNEMYFNLEIDMQALRGKNKELVESVAKVQKEKSLLLKRINLLQEEYFTLNSKYVNLKNIFSTIDSTAKLCFPKVAEVVNQLAKIMHVCSVGATISNSGDLKTQAVSPHRVNGTVIKSPTITLARFSDSPSMARCRLSNGGLSISQTSGVSQNVQNQNVNSNNNQETEPRPSTSRGFPERLSYVQNEENNVSNRENEGPSMDFVNRNRRIGVHLAPLNMEVELTEDEDNLEEAEQATENDEDYCNRLVTIAEESDNDYHNLSRTNTQLTDTVREIRIYLSPIRSVVKSTESSPNNSPEHLSYRSSSLLAEANNTMNNNTILNESSRSPNKSVRLNCSNKANEKSPTFYPEDWRDNGNDSFTFTNVSSISKSPNVEDSNPSCSNSSEEYVSKLITMESLGLMSTIANQLATSTPIVSSPRTRLSRKSPSSKSTVKNVIILRNSKSTVTKRKTSEEPNVAQVVIKRLNLDRSNTSIQELTKKLDTTPITSPKSIKKKSKRRIITSSTTSSNSTSEDDKPLVGRMKMKGKENKKVLETVQVPKSSPRPKRSARPESLREPRVNRKMRRSK